MKRSLLGTLVVAGVISLQGCTITSEIDGEEAVVIAGGEPVTVEHKLYQGISIGSVEGFSGTSMFAFTGNVSPDMTNEGVSYALSQTLANAEMLAQGDTGKYRINAAFVENNEEGAWGSDSWLFVGDVNRKTKINYTLTTNDSRDTIYDSVITSEGGLVESSLFGSAYMREKITARQSYINNFTQLVEELKQVD